MASIIQYTDLITSEHADKPNYVAMVGMSCQGQADLSQLYAGVPALYDVDVAVGEQLDVIGQWIGDTRQLTEAITGVYFSFDTVGVGFDEGVWLGPYDNPLGLVNLPDDFYRVVLAAKILNNHWNGSKADAYALMTSVFAPLGYAFLIQDPADLTMQLGIVGPTPPSPLLLALLTQGKFDIRPAGVLTSAYFYQSQAGPIFAFDFDTLALAGFDTGGWALAA